MPLASRVDPFGDLQAVSARGLLMGNRGGRFHLANRELGPRRWASRQWIACLCQFKGRHRNVWSKGYTELFFLDEITALAAGHRPCFECRRHDALAFQARFGHGGLPAAQMDRVLHTERLAAKQPTGPDLPAAELPDGAMVSAGGQAFARKGGMWLAWSFDGYGAAASQADGAMMLLTPPSILAVLSRGYPPLWHPSANAIKPA